MNLLFSLIFSYTPLKFYVQSFWRDEAFSYLLAKLPLLQLLTTTARDANPPLYYLLLHFWMLLFGSSEIAIRTVSFLFFLATIYVAGLMLMEFFKIPYRRMLVYLLLFVLNPLLHYYAFEGRMYSMFAFFSLLSFYFFYKKNYSAYLVVTLLGLYTHYFMFFVLMAQVVYSLLANRKSFSDLYQVYIKMFLLFAPWLLFVLSSKPPVVQKFWVPAPSLATLFLLPATIYTGYEDLIGFTYRNLPVISLSFCLFFVFAAAHVKLKKYPSHRRREHDSLLVFLLVWICVPIASILLISLFKPVFVPRYMIFITLGFLLLFIYFLEKLDRQARVLIFAVAILFSLHYGAYQVTMRTKADIRKTLKEIAATVRSGDVVYVTDPYDFHPAEYYINDKSVYIYGKSYDQLPWYIGKVLIPPDKIATSLPTYPKRAFVMDGDSTFSVQALY